MVVLTISNFFPYLWPSRESEQLYITILAMQCLQFFSTPSASHKQKKNKSIWHHIKAYCGDKKIYIVLTSNDVYTSYKAFHTLLAIVGAVNDHQ